jgi:hypothetical protein
MITGIDRASMKKGEFDLIIRFDNQYQRLVFEKMLDEIRGRFNGPPDVMITVSTERDANPVHFHFIKAPKSKKCPPECHYLPDKDDCPSNCEHKS